MSAEKYQSGLFHDRCRLLSFQFNPWTKFAWCRLGNVRSASSFEASFLDLDRSCFRANVDCHFFRSISANNIFLPRWANLFLAEKMGTCQFRPKQNVSWAGTIKPSRPTFYIFYATPKQENFLCRKKNIICQRAFLNKNCAMSVEKYQSGLFHDRCRLLSFLFNPWTKYAWSRIANIFLPRWANVFLAV